MSDNNALQIKYEGDLKFREPSIAAFKETYDPEIPVDIYELGLIYGLDVSEEGTATVTMTLTSPACPAAESIPAEIEARLRAIQGIEDVKIDIVWDPPWSQEMMSEVAKVSLGFF
ncbi:MAG: SUF system Fe-S cluster assembly protein [Gemmatimonadota bacterium]|nr:MAG: SUF system Fe-S cluster assembly protein [Gemmatimonadota bacterium]